MSLLSTEGLFLKAGLRWPRPEGVDDDVRIGLSAQPHQLSGPTLSARRR